MRRTQLPQKAALDHANEFLSLAQSQPDSWVLATGYWLVGRIRITIELRAAVSLARLLSDRCRRDEARDVLAPVYGCSPRGLGPTRP
jgi:hypothetical protein